MTLLTAEIIVVTALVGILINEEVQAVSGCTLNKATLGLTLVGLVDRGLVVASLIYQTILCIDAVKHTHSVIRSYTPIVYGIFLFLSLVQC